MSSTDEASTSALATNVATLATMVTDLRRATDVGFAKMEGELRVINEKMAFIEAKYEDGKEHRVKLDERITVMEKDYVTRRSVYAMLTLLGLFLSIAIAIVAVFQF